MTSDIQEQKKKLRKEILAKRKNLSPDYVRTASVQIGKKLMETVLYKEATDVCLYVPIRNEVDLFRFADSMLADGKRVWLPRVKDNKMDFYSYGKGVPLIEGAYHIPEPDSSCMLCPEETGGSCLIVMPGAVFSKENGRIGYGGGYYDRYLAEHNGCSTIAVGYAMQILDSIPTEATDICPEMIIWNENK